MFSLNIHQKILHFPYNRNVVPICQQLLLQPQEAREEPE